MAFFMQMTRRMKLISRRSIQYVAAQIGNSMSSYRSGKIGTELFYLRYFIYEAVAIYTIFIFHSPIVKKSVSMLR